VAAFFCAARLQLPQYRHFSGDNPCQIARETRFLRRCAKAIERFALQTPSVAPRLPGSNPSLVRRATLVLSVYLAVMLMVVLYHFLHSRQRGWSATISAISGSRAGSGLRACRPTGPTFPACPQK